MKWYYEYHIDMDIDRYLSKRKIQTIKLQPLRFCLFMISLIIHPNFSMYPLVFRSTNPVLNWDLFIIE